MAGKKVQDSVQESVKGDKKEAGMLCPHCHSPIKENATFCPHCGSDKDTGWSEGAEFTDLETPDYDEIVEKEFGEKKNKANPLAIAAAVIVALAFIAAMVF